MSGPPNKKQKISHWTSFNSIADMRALGSLPVYQKQPKIPKPWTKEDSELALSISALMAEKLDERAKNSQQRVEAADWLAKRNLPPASDWDLEVAIYFQLAFLPLQDITLVLPKEYIVDAEEARKECGELLSPKVDETYIREKKWKDYNKRDLFYVFCRRLHEVIEEPVPLEPSETSLHEEEEKYTNTCNLFQSLCDYLSFGDVNVMPLKLRVNHLLKVKIGEALLTAKFEFAFVDPQTLSPLIFVWVENKRLLPNDTFPSTVAQKLAESLAVCMHNYIDNSVPVKRDQEVFGIAVRHRFVSFWHCLLPVNYLQKMHKDPAGLSPTDIGIVKCSPVSEYGWDLCNPEHRLLIVQYIMSLIEYIKSGEAKIGNHTVV